MATLDGEELASGKTDDELVSLEDELSALDEIASELDDDGGNEMSALELDDEAVSLEADDEPPVLELELSSNKDCVEELVSKGTEDEIISLEDDAVFSALNELNSAELEEELEEMTLEDGKFSEADDKYEDPDDKTEGNSIALEAPAKLD